jgi:hypothetical protein
MHVAESSSSLFCLWTGLSLPAALHPVSRRRSCLKLVTPFWKDSDEANRKAPNLPADASLARISSTLVFAGFGLQTRRPLAIIHKVIKSPLGFLD